MKPRLRLYHPPERRALWYPAWPDGFIAATVTDSAAHALLLACLRWCLARNLAEGRLT